VRTSVAAQSAEGAQLAGAESPKVKCEPFAPANTGGRFAEALTEGAAEAEAEATRGALDLGAGRLAAAVGSADDLAVLAGGAAEADASALKATELAGVAALEAGKMEVTEEGDAGAVGAGVATAGARERMRNAPTPPTAARSEMTLTIRFMQAMMRASALKCKLARAKLGS
jgi:hypothetical protein